MKYSESFCEGRSNYRSFDYVIDDIRKREFRKLRDHLKVWAASRRCFTDNSLFAESRKCIASQSLRWLDRNWDPSKNIKWFHATILEGRKRPDPAHRELYEYVENQVNRNGYIDVKTVREQSSLLIDPSFGKYKKFEKLGGRIKKLLNLEVKGVSGKKTRWVKKG